MRTPAGLQALIDDGVIDAVLRPLKSGKEAA
ncbi:MAG: serine protein kinase RIO, partial [Betaproteobacteria bacterium]